LAAFDLFGVEYLVVGGVAVGLHAEPRYTKDIDVLVHVNFENLNDLIAALRHYGAPLHFVQEEQFLNDDFVFYFGSQPWRVDVLTSIPGVNFKEAFEDRVLLELGGRPVNCISKDWLIRAKLASGRHQDLADVEALQRSGLAEDQ
jgi:hypothetical protein